MLEDVAIITIIQNGNEFFKLWYKYYSKIIPKSNIYVIDYCSTDGSTDFLECNIIKNSESSIENVPQGNKLINELKQELLKKFKYVIYTDYDEILFHPLGLAYVLAQKHKYYTTQGYEIVQKSDEAPIDFNKSIFSQRTHWYRCADYDKPLITSINFKWAHGNHSAILEMPNHNIVLQPNYFDNFYLLHLHKVDYTHCKNLKAKNVKELGTPIVGGNHNFLINDAFEKWWNSFQNKLVNIPSEIRALSPI